MKTEAQQVIYDMASEIADLAQEPINNERRKAWASIWTDRPERPMILTRPLIIDSLTGYKAVGEDAFLRTVQHMLSGMLYKFKVIRDDDVLEPTLLIPAIFKDGTVENNMFGANFAIRRGPQSFVYENPVVECIDDLQKLHFPDPEVDEKAIGLLVEKAAEAVDGKLRIAVDRIRSSFNIWPDPVLFANYFVGYENLLAGMAEDPEFIHAVMRFFTDAIIYNFLEAEKRGYLPDVSRSIWLDIPNYLPGESLNTPASRLDQLICTSGGEEFDPVSPEMSEEFLFRYEREIFRHFKYTHYGCCESFHRKWHLLRSIPNLKMYSCSPWTNLQEAVNEMGKQYAIDWRVKVQKIIFDQDVNDMKEEVRQGLNIASGCPIACVLQDIQTTNGNPNLVSQWVEAARRGAEESHW